MRQIIGPDVRFYQDNPGTPQEVNFVGMNEATDFVIIRAGKNIWIDSDFKNSWRKAEVKNPSFSSNQIIYTQSILNA